MYDILKLFLIITLFYAITIYILECIGKYCDKNGDDDIYENYADFTSIASFFAGEVEDCDGIIFATTETKPSCVNAYIEWLFNMFATTTGYIIVFICFILLIVLIASSMFAWKRHKKSKVAGQQVDGSGEEVQEEAQSSGQQRRPQQPEPEPEPETETEPETTPVSGSSTRDDAGEGVQGGEETAAAQAKVEEEKKRLETEAAARERAEQRIAEGAARDGAEEQGRGKTGEEVRAAQDTSKPAAPGAEQSTSTPDGAGSSPGSAGRGRGKGKRKGEGRGGTRAGGGGSNKGIRNSHLKLKLEKSLNGGFKDLQKNILSGGGFTIGDKFLLRLYDRYFN